MKNANFKPLNGRVLIEEIKEDTKTASGIITTTSEAATTGKGVIVAIDYPDEVRESGPQNEKKAVIGDKVAYNKNAGGVLNLKSGTFRQLIYTDIYGVITE